MEIKRRQFIKQLASCCLLAFHPISQNSIMDSQGIITRTSPFGVKETIDRLVTLLEKRGNGLLPDRSAAGS